MLDDIRDPLLAEARLSPRLLADLAGLERYIAESYSARSIIELLQNADDAGARKFAVVTMDDHVIIANNGHAFTSAEFESLCRSASSQKARGTSIGYRGIGFKSVVGVASVVYVLSAGLKAKFGRPETSAAVGVSSDVPLIRIPHPIPKNEEQQLDVELAELRSEGYVTFFVLRTTLHGVGEECAAFDESALLFLRSIEEVSLRSGVSDIITISRGVSGNVSTATIRRSGSEQQWFLTNGESGSTVAVGASGGIPIACDAADAVFHAFLPTLDVTGLRLKINGDFSTDPSRTRLVLDERTAAVFSDAARTLSQMLRHSVESANCDLLEAVVGTLDPRTIQYQRKSAATVFLQALHDAAEWSRSVRLSPTWLQALEFARLADRVGLLHLPASSETRPGVQALMRFLGAEEASFSELEIGLLKPLSLPGAADIAAYCVSRIALKQMDASTFDETWPIWWDGDGLVSMEALSQVRRIDRSFVDLLVERGLSEHMLKAFLDAHMRVDALPPASSPEENRENAISSLLVTHANYAEHPAVNVALRRWRTAEQYIVDILKADGFSVADVSRQNVGYDIEARNEQGQMFAIEVKLLDYVGVPFVITSNEEAVARQLGKHYIIALVQQDSSTVNVMMISNPIASLAFVRQCRQWVWECSEYKYQPASYKLL